MQQKLHDGRNSHIGTSLGVEMCVNDMFNRLFDNDSDYSGLYSGGEDPSYLCLLGKHSGLHRLDRRGTSGTILTILDCILVERITQLSMPARETLDSIDSIEEAYLDGFIL